MDQRRANVETGGLGVFHKGTRFGKNGARSAMRKIASKLRDRYGEGFHGKITGRDLRSTGISMLIYAVYRNYEVASLSGKSSICNF